MGTCAICGNSTQPAFSTITLKKYTFDAMICPHCGFLQAANPHWLNEAYSEAIAACDTGLVARNLSLAATLSPLFFHLFGTDGRHVDFAGGTGLFVRLMRDIGYDFYWRDPYCTNVHARGFEFQRGHGYLAVTAFEVLEHVVDPMEFVLSVFQDTGAEVLFFTTELFSGAPPKPDEWWYYAFDAGQHISFYQAKTLEIIADRLGMKFVSYNGIHVFCKTSLFDQMQRFYNSSVIRRIVRYKSKRMLESKTFSDHRFLLGQGTVSP